jgi:hypothetical protein
MICRLAAVLCLLSPAYALAGQATGSFGVGLIIVGPSTASTTKQKTDSAAPDTTAASATQPAKKARIPRNGVPSSDNRDIK